MRYAVALGDSLAEGYQPNGDYDHGYANLLYGALRADDPTLRLANLSCGGETTASMIDGTKPWGSVGSRYFCGYRARSANLAHGSQLADAVAFLRAHREFVSLVTIDIGGNDVLGCLMELDATCLAEGLPGVEARLSEILAVLREAAGPDVPIAGMTYYDPFSVLLVLGSRRR